jgi:hypothetical protein
MWAPHVAVAKESITTETQSHREKKVANTFFSAFSAPLR